jgi:transposase
LIGLPVQFLGGEDGPDGEARIFVQSARTRGGCPNCGSVAWVKDHTDVELIDLPIYGRAARTVWRKSRFTCPASECERKSFTEEDDRIAGPRQRLTSRAARWATEQVGRHARSVNEVAVELGCDWHTVNDTVVAYGELLIDDPDRFGTVEALGLDEVLFVRVGTYRTPTFSTQLVDVQRGQLLDVVEGKKAEEPTAWLENRGEEWLGTVRYATLDLSATYKAVFDATVPDAVQVADPFHVIKHATFQLDQCRRRVQQELLGHRGRKGDPLFRARRLLAKAHERLDERGNEKLTGLLEAGDPKGQVRMAWHAKESVRELYTHTDAEVALAFVDELVTNMADKDMPIEVRSLGRTLKRWRLQIAAWHTAQVTNGPTEAVNNLIKRVKRAAFGFTSFRNYRVRSLLYAGKPNWSRLATITPR